MSRTYRVHELAQALKVSDPTVYRWIDRGIVRAISAGWQVRIPEDEYQRILAQGVGCKRREELAEVSPSA